MKTLSARRRVRRRISENMTTPEAATMAVVIRPLGVRKVNSKKLWVNGMKNAHNIIPIITARRVLRNKLSGLEIQ